MLCLFAQHFPRSVAALLQRGQVLKRRFREETVTDLLMANLLQLGGGSIIVEFPDEPTTGADMEWNFINRAASELPLRSSPSLLNSQANRHGFRPAR
ncbi:DUF6615 family protein [Bradyrhizobium liaoningense]|uniref:DUF6615 family protein n=1 Tax=Bradyrhizobium liaoningense TaxID=43992 RepID=UPI003D9BC883